MTLTGEEFEREKRYQVLMCLVRQMLSSGLITREEYTQTAVLYAARLSPKTGSLLALNGLLSAREGDGMSADLSGREGTSDEIRDADRT